MARSTRLSTIRLGIVLLGAFGLLMGGMWANAAQPNDVIEQHWELLSQTLSQADSAESHLGIQRGILPSGTTPKFDPQPTASLEVVAKVTAGTGNGKWRVELIGPNNLMIAGVDVPFSQTTYGLRTASFTWPATDTPMESIRITGVATGSPPIIFGQIDVQKAYVKIRQAGTVKKTVGRVPMATRAQVTHQDWTDITDPFVYVHNAADFDPAPTATLRAAAQQYICGSYKVRLYNVDLGQAVPDSELSFGTSRQDKETPALDLIDGDRYKLQSRVDLSLVCPASGGDPNPVVPTGDLVNADLVLSQSTTDPEGIVKTVGWFPGVTSAVDFTGTSNLNFLFNSPVISLPNALQSTWVATAKRTGTGTVGTRLAFPSGASASNLASIPTNTNSDTYVALSAGGVVFPTGADKTQDSRSSVSGTATGRIAITILRIGMSLRDLTAPVFDTALSATNLAISPGVSIGSKDDTTFSARFTDFSPVTWTITIKNASQQIVRQHSVSGTNASNGLTVSWTWYGRNGSEVIVPDGNYSATISATDVQGSSSISPVTALSIAVDTVSPALTAYAVAPNPFSPSLPEDEFYRTTFSSNVSEASTWQLVVRQGNNNAVGAIATTQSGSANPAAVPAWSYQWSGTGASSDGPYTGFLTLTDPAGNSASGIAVVTRDTTGPAISAFAASNPDFSPGASIGSKDSTVLSAQLSDAWQPIDWVIDIKQGASVVKSYSATNVPSPTNISVTWTGLNAADQPVQDGSYTAELRANDEGRNYSVSSISLRVDRVAPEILDLAPRDGHNTRFATQPLQAVVEDDRSGIGTSPSGVSFELKDETLGTTASVAAAYDASTQVASTSVAPILTDGHDYTVQVQAEDRAGNEVTAGHLPYEGSSDPASGGFRKISAQPQAASAEIPSTPCTIESQGLSKIAVCSGVGIQLGQGSIAVSSSRHSFSTGFITHTVTLEDAQLQWLVAGVPVATINAYDARLASGTEWQARSADYRVDIGDSSALPATFSAVPDTNPLQIDTLRVAIPSSWSGATSVALRMDALTENPAADACSAPLSSTVACDTDPLWSHFTVMGDPGLSESQREAIISSHHALGIQIVREYSTPNITMTHWPLYEGPIEPSRRQSVGSTAGVVGVLPLRSDNIEDRYETLLAQRPPGSPSQDPDSVSWYSAETKVTQDLSLLPTEFSQLIFESEFIDGSNDTDGTGETPAASEIYAIKFRPDDPTLLPDSAANASAQRRVRYQSSTGNYWTEVQAMEGHGIRLAVWLHEEDAPRSYDFDLQLPAGTTLRTGDDGSAVLTSDSAGPADPPLAVFPPPLAYDAQGLEVPVEQAITSSTITLQLDLTDSRFKFPVLVDPGASRISCQPATLTGSTEEYLNVGFTYGPPHSGVCPYGITFYDASYEQAEEDSVPYFPMAQPVCAHSTCKERAINYVGDKCTTVPESHGSYWNFEVPCMMHDYGYDLIRVKEKWGYDGVTKSGVDNEFYEAMEESCAPKPFWEQRYCQSVSDHYHLGVITLGGFALDPHSRPTDPWPSYSFLQNTDFRSGMRYWEAVADGEERVAADTYSSNGTRFIAFTCKDDNDCRLRQPQGISLWGGESLSAHFLVRCKPLGEQQPETCPLTFSIWAKRTSDGVWVQQGLSKSANAPKIQEGSGWWSVDHSVQVDTGTGNGKQYNGIRFVIRNNSINNRLDMIQPYLVLAG